MGNKGWVKLHRRVLENIFLMRDDKAFVVFTKLLLMANSKGQVGESTRELADYWETPHSTVYKVLRRLEQETLISMDGKRSYTLISICNWNKYQETGKHLGKQMGNTKETQGKRLTGVPRIENKELRKGNNSEENKTLDRASRMTAERIRQQLREKGIVK